MTMRSIFFAFACFVGLLSPAVHGQITTPTDIPDLVRWYDGSNIAGNGTEPADGSLVNSWADLSGNGGALAPNGGVPAPTYDDDGWNGTCGALRFGETTGNDLSGTDPFGGTQTESTIFAVYRENTRRQGVLGSFNGGTSGTDQSYILVWNNGLLYQRIGGFLSGAHGVTVGQPFFSTFHQNTGGTPARYIQTNGTQVANTNTVSSAPTTGGINLGWTWSNTLYYLDGWIAEVMIYDRALSAAEVADVENYMTTKWSAENANCSLVQDVDMALTKVATNTTPDEGQQFNYVISLTNNGAIVATNVEVEDILPTGLTFISATVTQGSVTP